MTSHSGTTHRDTHVRLTEGRYYAEEKPWTNFMRIYFSYHSFFFSASAWQFHLLCHCHKFVVSDVSSGINKGESSHKIAALNQDKAFLSQRGRIKCHIWSTFHRRECYILIFSLGEYTYNVLCKQPNLIGAKTISHIPKDYSLTKCCKNSNSGTMRHLMSSFFLWSTHKLVLGIPSYSYFLPRG